MIKIPDLVVLKNKKGDKLEGDFYVKYLKFSELQDMWERVSNGGFNQTAMQNAIVQMCLVRKDGAEVFKRQQANLIEDRLPGMMYADVIARAEELNQFSRQVGSMSEDYAKNSESDQN